MQLLEVNEVTQGYGRDRSTPPVIADISFAVQDEQFVSIVGPSGCGKTTLLKCVSGLMQPRSGTVRLAGEPVSGPPRDLALVFQDYGRSLFPWLKVAANVRFPLKGQRLSRTEQRQRVEESLHSVGLADHADKYPWELSGGMQQRAAIARALAYRPRVLVMDEPFASVDAQTRSDLEDLTLAVSRRYAMTVLFVTHDIDESVYLSNRVIVLGRGPGHVIADIDVHLPAERDQITTKEHPQFVAQRAEVARLIRQAAGATPLDTSTDHANAHHSTASPNQKGHR